MNIDRIYSLPSKSFFLFGPRGVGKSTWVKKNISYQVFIDLLNHKNFIELQRSPDLLEAKTAHLNKGNLVFIDEIQKLPVLLDEVHRLMEEKKLEFVLTGSSARKLKRESSNLLAGRAHSYKMYPFSLMELGNRFSIESLLDFGCLPVVLRDFKLAEETLSSYVETYLREEIKEEALVRRVEEFSRFLSVAGMLNAQILNFENVSRDTGKTGKTIISWYQILQETLLGYLLPPYRPGFKVRESGHPKFYWFDTGVARLATGLSLSDVDSTWRGFALEAFILKELLIYLEVKRKRNGLFYYGSPGAGEIDFIIETRKKTINQPQEFISLEVKYTKKWKREYEGPSRSLFQFAGKKHKKMMGVYLGAEQLTFEGFQVFPVHAFIKKLFNGELF